ncbi:MAG: hypothetical protein ED557_00620 [Balneola sp.]|nr:MAG: hypothetical protein ED557_00620 [Balneola sp.]
MKKLRFIGIFFLAITTACSSSKWVVENQQEVDRNDFELLSSRKFLERSGAISPQTPIVSYQLKAENTFEYALRVRTDRYIQRYRPTFRSILFGLIGSGLAIGAGNIVADNKDPGSDSNTEYILYGAAGVIGLASVLNMKAYGDPTPTGESRLLRKTGSTTEVEVVTAAPESDLRATYSIFYKSEILVGEKEIKPNGSTYSINLIEDLNPEAFEYDSSDDVELEVYFNGETYRESISLKDIFDSFVIVSSQITALRDAPDFDENNVLTDLAFGSQMKMVSEDSTWYKVLYGISETWISKTDAYPIWRPSEFASQLSIFAIPNIPFGNVDVETSIPTLRTGNDSTLVFMLVNGGYQRNYPERPFADRDARLMEEYFQNALGIPFSNIIKAYDIENQQQLSLAYTRLATRFRRPQKQLVVYLSGYVRSDEEERIRFLSTTGSNQSFSLNSLVNSISTLDVEEIVVLADLDFVAQEEPGSIEYFGESVLQNNPNSAIIFSSTETQRSRDYSIANGDQKRHSIFTYYIADAIKNGESNISGIINHLQRNVDYTSRRLHNQPQQIIYFGETNLDLVD